MTSPCSEGSSASRVASWLSSKEGFIKWPDLLVSLSIRVSFDTDKWTKRMGRFREADGQDAVPIDSAPCNASVTADADAEEEDEDGEEEGDDECRGAQRKSSLYRRFKALQVITIVFAIGKVSDIHVDIAISQGSLSSSVSGVPLFILSMLAALWNSSASRKTQPICCDNAFPTVVFPLPITPINNTMLFPLPSIIGCST